MEECAFVLRTVKISRKYRWEPVPLLLLLVGGCVRAFEPQLPAQTDATMDSRDGPATDLPTDLLSGSDGPDTDAVAGDATTDLGPPKTFGKPTPGTSWGGHTADGVRVCKFTLTEEADLMAVVVYLQGSDSSGGKSQSLRVVVYAANLNGEPDALVGQSAAKLLGGDLAAGWVTFELIGAPIRVQAGELWLGDHGGSPEVVQYSYVGESDAMRIGGSPFANGAPALYPPKSPMDRRISIYVTYYPVP